MEDFNLSPGKAVINDDYNYLLQQIDLLFDATPGDLHGNINWGTDYEYNLYNLNMSATGLREQMLADLEKLDLRGYEPYVDVQLYQGTERDIALIEVTLSSGSNTINKIYKIS